jgi:hypothetical protein
MTFYWPASVVAQCLQPAQRSELACPQRGISQPTMIACHRATSKIPACTSMAVIYSEGVTGSRRVYLDFPSCEQWIALERGGFMEIRDDFGFVMDALH